MSEEQNWELPLLQTALGGAMMCVAPFGSPLPYATAGSSWEGSQAQPGGTLLSSGNLILFT